jgi:hypothetical protein
VWCLEGAAEEGVKALRTLILFSLPLSSTYVM